MKKCLSLNSIRAFKARGYCNAVQPIVTGDIASNAALAGYELLSRHHRQGYPVRPPSRFISRLPLTHLSTLDALGLMNAIEHVAASDGTNLTFNFNCSIRNLLRLDFVTNAVNQISTIDERNRHRLVLEITETERVDDRQMSQQWGLLQSNVEMLARTGIRIAIDDFGCGNACLRLARGLPITVIKFSKSVLDDCVLADNSEPTHHDQMSLDLMRCIGQTMRGWGCDVIVEGLEREDQIPTAVDLGANLFQGYFFGEPTFVRPSSLNHGQFRMAANY